MQLQEYEIEMCKNQINQRTVYTHLRLKDSLVSSEENILYFNAFRNIDMTEYELRISHDKRGYWTTFHLLLRKRGEKSWIHLDRWEAYIT